MQNSTSSRWRRRIRILVIDVLIFLLVYTGIQLWVGRNAVSGHAPAFSGVLMDGRTVSLEDYRGKPLLLHFWSSWCRICRLEHDSIDSIAEDYAVITVMTRSGSEREATQYLVENGIQAPVLLDENGVLADRYNVRGVPTTIIVSPDGQISDVEIGYSSEPGLRARLWLAGW